MNADWIPWSGGECPVERAAIITQVRLKNGREDEFSGRSAGSYDWKHRGGALDIIAYRVVKP